MATNSIISNLNRDDVISEIKMYLSDKVRAMNCVVVEGKDDIKFIKRFCCENVVVVESYSGKLGVKEILESFGDESRVVGIRDRDYEDCELSKKLFYYDYCCLEAMLLSNKDVFSRVCSEFYEGSVDIFELEKQMLESLKSISIFRKLNEINRWKINFNGVKITNIIDKNKKVDFGKLVSEINKMNDDVVDLEKQTIVAEEIKKIETREDSLNIVNGHDYLELFQNICNQYRKKGYKKDEIASSLRCAYSRNEFKKSSLFENLNKYQIDNNIKVMQP